MWTKVKSVLKVAAAGIIAACSGGLDDARYPVASSAIVSSSNYDALLVANADHGSITRMAPDGSQKSVLELGSDTEPTRLARHGDRVFASLRNARSVAVIHDNGETLTLETTIDTGAEPFGLVVDEAGKRLYVAASLEGRVQEFDLETLTMTREWPIAQEPRFLAISPKGNSLYVGSAFGGVLSYIDLDAKNKVQSFLLPERTTEVPDSQRNFGPDGPFEPQIVSLTPRITGDMTVTPDGKFLVVPGLYVNNTSPVNDINMGLEPNPSEDSSMPQFEDFPAGDSGGYAAGPDGVGRFNPVVVEIPVDGDEPVIAEAEIIDAVGPVVNEGQINSYPSSVTVSPETGNYWITLEASDAVLVISGADDRKGFSGVKHLFGDSSSFVGKPRAKTLINTDKAPRGVAFLSSTTAHVSAAFSRSVASLPVETARDNVNTLRSSDQIDRDFDFAAVEIGISLNAGQGVQSAPQVLPDEVVRGRDLFFSARNPRIAQVGAGVSCSTCHADGRTDGLTWHFGNNTEFADQRQTPSLAGKISLTAPVTWTQAVGSVAEEAMLTSSARMGGRDLQAIDADNIAAYIDFSRRPDTRLLGSTDPRIDQGREIFNREDVGCGGCHSGVAFADDGNYQMYGLDSVGTRSLVGIAASAPYLHDGSAKTLREVLERSRSGLMGDTSSLSDDEMMALELYLQSL